MAINLSDLSEEQMRQELARLMSERAQLIDDMINNQNLQYTLKGALSVLVAKKNDCNCKKGPTHDDQAE